MKCSSVVLSCYKLNALHLVYKAYISYTLPTRPLLNFNKANLTHILIDAVIPLPKLSDFFFKWEQK